MWALPSQKPDWCCQTILTTTLWEHHHSLEWKRAMKCCKQKWRLWGVPFKNPTKNRKMMAIANVVLNPNATEAAPVSIALVTITGLLTIKLTEVSLCSTLEIVRVHLIKWNNHEGRKGTIRQQVNVPITFTVTVTSECTYVWEWAKHWQLLSAINDENL